MHIISCRFVENVQYTRIMSLNPMTLGIGGALSLGGMVYSAIKGGQAAKANERLIDQQDEQNEAFYNNSRNYFDTVQGKSALEQVRQAYEDRSKRDANTAVVTGATAETEIAQKDAANKGYSDVMRQLASQGGEYAMRNEGIYRQNLSNIYAMRMGVNGQQAQSAANLSGNMMNLFGAAAEGGLFEAGDPAEKAARQAARLARKNS
jgi:hypothetical protein